MRRMMEFIPQISELGVDSSWREHKYGFFT